MVLGRGSENCVRDQTINDNLQHGRECRSSSVLLAWLLKINQGVRTFLISSALRCRLTSFSVLTTGIVLGLEVPANGVKRLRKDV